MADREQSHTSKRGMDEKPQGDIAGKGHPNSRSKGEERGHGRARRAGPKQGKEHGNRGRGWR